jgi:hypothetical protein
MSSRWSFTPPGRPLDLRSSQYDDVDFMQPSLPIRAAKQSETSGITLSVGNDDRIGSDR